MKTQSLTCFFLALGLPGASAQAEIKASVDSDQVAPGDTIELTLAYDGQTSSQPNVAPLARDFEVLSTSRSNSVRIVNGAQSSETQLRLTLSPKRSGQLTIPALTWQNEQSSPIVITVTGSGSSASGAASQAQSSNVFLETKVDDSRPYVQGAVKVTVRLYAAVPLRDASITLPASSDVLVEQLGKDRSSHTERNGQRYEMIERDYLLFPQHSGALDIPGPVLDARVPTRSRGNPFPDDSFPSLFDQSIFADMMQTARPIRIHADNIALEVRPRPASATASYWIPAKHLSITSEWRPESLEVPAGEPITLNLRMRAEGLTAAQLPDIASLMQLPSGLNAYPDDAKLENTAENGTVVGAREQSIALIAQRSGDFHIPAMNIQWWDTSAEQLRTIDLPAIKIKALPAVSGSKPIPGKRAEQGEREARGEGPLQQSSASALAGASSWHWGWLSIGVPGAIALGMAFLWRHSRRRASTTSVTPRPAPVPRRDESRARSDFLAACKLSDPRSARRALLDWAQAKWPDSPPVGLQDVAARLEDPELTGRLQELDRACFAGDGWSGAGLAKAFEHVPRRSSKKHDTQRSALAEIYPQS